MNDEIGVEHVRVGGAQTTAQKINEHIVATVLSCARIDPEAAGNACLAAFLTLASYVEDPKEFARAAEDFAKRLPRDAAALRLRNMRGANREDRPD